MQLSKVARLILVGAPGVGKGTQSERLLKRFEQLSAISSGDLLRENVRNRTELGMQVQKLMASGKLVPDAIILRLILAELTNRGWLKPQASTAATDIANAEQLERSQAYYEHEDKPSASFILDGFPRTAAQAQQLDALVPINLVVHINTPTSIILERIANRWVHAPSGRVYNTTFNPPKTPGKDDVTGEPLMRREDDDPDTWKARLRRFEETSMPLLEHYDKLGVLWRVDGNSSDEISPKLFEQIDRKFEATP